MLLSDSGSFYEGYFVIEIEDELIIDEFENNSRELKGTFIHEYTHFLQGITTLYGFNHFILGLEEIYRLIYKKKTGNNFIEKLKDLYSLYDGDAKHCNDCPVIVARIDNNIVDEQLFDDTSIQVEQIIINYSNRKTYHFGNKCVAESMAYLTERCLYGVRERYDDFPYNSVEILAKHIYKERELKDYELIALCEIALQVENSGAFIFKVLQKMNEEKFNFNTIDDLIQFIDTYFETYFEWDIEMLKNLLELVYPNDDEFNKNKSWIYNRFEYGKKLRMNHKCFLGYILEKNKDIQFMFLQSLLEDIGVPPIVNGEGVIYWGDKNDDEVELRYILAPFAYRQYKSYNKCPFTNRCNIKESCICLEKENSQEQFMCSLYSYYIWVKDRQNE